ncbi:MAG TPA: nitrilase-related carbon-nitrogen hydrolase, partial [Polyangiales bacterium]|nr:nitrilase-related carbon-nitrogen hydrolase [Polyangiales bacterium]
MRGFARIVTAIPRAHVASPQQNLQATLALCKEADAQQAQVVVFPELGLTGYTARDLFASSVLLEGALRALGDLCDQTKKLAPLILVGLPLRAAQGVYNV